MSTASWTRAPSRPSCAFRATCASTRWGSTSKGSKRARLSEACSGRAAPCTTLIGSTKRRCSRRWHARSHTAWPRAAAPTCTARLGLIAQRSRRWRTSPGPRVGSSTRRSSSCGSNDRKRILTWSAGALRTLGCSRGARRSSTSRHSRRATRWRRAGIGSRATGAQPRASSSRIRSGAGSPRTAPSQRRRRRSRERRRSKRLRSARSFSASFDRWRYYHTGACASTIMIGRETHEKTNGGLK
mmetsp:Transcript_26616/g.87266  ORF Transcript_26616/g.87266 Transcript_26616/m.87266 type:complete len:242 (-) Transcript_26616:805-1530(-)